MYATATSFAIQGVEGYLVTVEADIGGGLPHFELVGLPDAAVREARERVRTAIRNAGLSFPSRRITVNLAPAHTRKEGVGFDLPIALAVLAAAGEIDRGRLSGWGVVGELSLSGTLRPVDGVLAMAAAARAAGLPGLIVPAANAWEAALPGGLRVLPTDDLAEAVGWLRGEGPEPGASRSAGGAGSQRGRRSASTALLEHQVVSTQSAASALDLADVRGQAAAKRALVVAAAGHHNLLMLGPPGSGKTMLAARLTGILPPLTEEEALLVTRIHSVAGQRPAGMITDPPLRAPHHSISRAAMLGSGGPPRPGEVSLAHHGALFLDEAPEFSRDVLEGLREPVESGRVSLARAAGVISLPAQVMLVAAANPCPCGWSGDAEQVCTCPPGAVRRYLGKLSGPLLDRFDLQVWLRRVGYADLRQEVARPSSADVQEQVLAARERQRERLGAGRYNTDMTAAEMRQHCRPDRAGEELLRQGFERLGLSARGCDRVLRLARTIADLDGAAGLAPHHIAEAMQFRLTAGSMGPG